MNKISAGKIHYEILGLIGEGLSSQVYKAFRIDSEGWLRHRVALKVIKSRKNVQVLKMEFEKLIHVHSTHCVRVFGWENLPQGPALVLECIEGISLAFLLQEVMPSLEVQKEILRQLRLGINDLHQNGLVHGDLNLKNILIDNTGTVKLIDFGFASSKEVWAAPFFACPRVLEGGVPDADSDWYAFKKIADWMCQKGEGLSSSLSDESRCDAKDVLAQHVRTIKNCDSSETQILKKKFVEPPLSAFYSILLVMLLFILTLIPDNFAQQEDFVSFNVGADHWIQLSIQDLPPVFGPVIDLKLRQGDYKIWWKTAHEEKDQIYSLSDKTSFWLNRKAKSLK